MGHGADEYILPPPPTVLGVKFPFSEEGQDSQV